MLFYLVLMLFIALVISILIYIGIAGTLASDSVSGVIAGPASKSDQFIALPWHSLKISVLLILASGLLVSAGLGYAWYRISSRMLERPVRIVLRALDQLARGQLNETVNIETPDEFGQIGASINELAANLQELLLYIWKQTGQCMALLEHVQNNPDLHHDRRLTLESLGYLKQLSESIDDLREMAKSYVFYDVSLDGNTTQAINEPGKKSSSEQPS
jgi:methyl-accepting chemotaxis protein